MEDLMARHPFWLVLDTTVDNGESTMAKAESRSVVGTENRGVAG